jgi:hypothetical protein
VAPGQTGTRRLSRRREFASAVRGRVRGSCLAGLPAGFDVVEVEGQPNATTGAGGLAHEHRRLRPLSFAASARAEPLLPFVHISHFHYFTPLCLRRPSGPRRASASGACSWRSSDAALAMRPSPRWSTAGPQGQRHRGRPRRDAKAADVQGLVSKASDMKDEQEGPRGRRWPPRLRYDRRGRLAGPRIEIEGENLPTRKIEECSGAAQELMQRTMVEVALREGVHGPRGRPGLIDAVLAGADRLSSAWAGLVGGDAALLEATRVGRATSHSKNPTGPPRASGTRGSRRRQSDTFVVFAGGNEG